MKYLVSNVSVGYDDKPCTEATFERYTGFDIRNTDDPAKIPAYHGQTDWWYASGKNHRIVQGQIVRDVDLQGYFVEFNVLEDLEAFIRKYGEVVIMTPNNLVEQCYLEMRMYDEG